MTIYALPLSAGDIRAWLRREFEKNRHITDSKVLDVLNTKGRLVRRAPLRHCCSG